MTALKTFTMPPDTRAPGTVNPSGDMNSVTDALAAVLQSLLAHDRAKGV